MCTAFTSAIMEDEADLMSKRYPKKKERNHYVHPNPRRLYCIMPADEASKRPKEEYTELEITGNVRRLSSTLWQMTSLTSLYLNNNSLTSIPGEISLLVNLAHLNLSFNQLRNIPPEMGDMTSLRELLLNNNNISTLPTQLGKLFKLCKLELNGNPLGGHIMDIIRSPTCRTEDILSYLIDHLPVCFFTCNNSATFSILDMFPEASSTILLNKLFTMISQSLNIPKL
ncbi:CCR4-NOT transcription complex subunit 6-like [Nephila pilipes]|uniref:CCR4-NOT transcription complex subunit 6-like n=1 Tax=Nephila pilipes TaxID=299642 RepID=A0A8X6UPT9_NEPPI|nr:CCR4-NOT transcription complex subunit 6-like [Nephila pilipes]